MKKLSSELLKLPLSTVVPSRQGLQAVPEWGRQLLLEVVLKLLEAEDLPDDRKERLRGELIDWFEGR